MNQLKTKLGRKCQVCHSQSQEIQQLRAQLKDAELLSIENESLAVGTQKLILTRIYMPLPSTRSRIRVLEKLARRINRAGVSGGILINELTRVETRSIRGG